MVLRGFKTNRGGWPPLVALFTLEEVKLKKPPAFQFYAKDWRSSPTVLSMSMHHRGIYITLLAAAWDSEEPGTLPLPIEIAARSAQLDPRSLRDFLSKYPRCFLDVGGKLVNHKLRENWHNYIEIRDKRKKAAESRYSANAHANAEQVHHPASAPASASAPKVKNVEPKTIGQQKSLTAFMSDDFLQFWSAYPKKVAKQDAAMVWNRMLLEDRLQAVAGLKKWRDAGKFSDGQFIPHPSTYLRGRRWNDELENFGGKNGKDPQAEYRDRMLRNAAALGLTATPKPS